MSMTFFILNGPIFFVNNELAPFLFRFLSSALYSLVLIIMCRCGTLITGFLYLPFTTIMNNMDFSR